MHCSISHQTLLIQPYHLLFTPVAQMPSSDDDPLSERSTPQLTYPPSASGGGDAARSTEVAGEPAPPSTEAGLTGAQASHKAGPRESSGGSNSGTSSKHGSTSFSAGMALLSQVVHDRQQQPHHAAGGGGRGGDSNKGARTSLNKSSAVVFD